MDCTCRSGRNCRLRTWLASRAQRNVQRLSSSRDTEALPESGRRLEERSTGMTANWTTVGRTTSLQVETSSGVRRAEDYILVQSFVQLHGGVFAYSPHGNLSRTIHSSSGGQECSQKQQGS